MIGFEGLLSQSRLCKQFFPTSKSELISLLNQSLPTPGLNPERWDVQGTGIRQLGLRLIHSVIETTNIIIFVWILLDDNNSTEQLVNGRYE